jgi:hypothetical protein
MRLANAGLSTRADSLLVVSPLMRRFLFETSHDVALMIDRERAGREAGPSAGIIDSQSVKRLRPERGGACGSNARQSRSIADRSS